MQREHRAERRNDEEGDPPTEQAVKRTSEQRRKARRSRHRNHGQRRASSSPSNRSRAMARDRTEAAQAPSAWMTRPRTRKDKVSAKAQRTLPATKTARPPSTSHLRPKRSESGPTKSCQIGRASCRER